MGRKMNMKNEKKIKVLVADNSEFARNNLKKFLENNEKIQLLNIADNGKDAYRVIIDEVPVLFLLTLSYQLWTDLLLLKKQMETEVLRKNRYLLLFPLWEINQW